MNQSLREMTDQTMTIAEQFQNDAHEIVEKVMEESPEVSYADAMMIFIFNKLASLQSQINKLKTLQ